MRTVLIGAVESSAAALDILRSVGHPPDLVLTLDPETGRARHADYVDLAPLAGSETEVICARNVNAPEVVARVRELDPDFLFIIGWSQIVGPDLMGAARHFAIGFHPTALPLHRGRAPIAWTILLDVERTGSSLFVIDEGVDSGPLLAQISLDVAPRETAQSLMRKQIEALRTMLAGLVQRLATGQWDMRVQDESAASYCAARRPEDGLIDWSEDAKSIDRLIRAVGGPYSGAFTFAGRSRITIWESEPAELPNPYYGQSGQILYYVEGCPVVLCGDGKCLRLTKYENDSGRRLAGQLRFSREVRPS